MTAAVQRDRPLGSDSCCGALSFASQQSADLVIDVKAYMMLQHFFLGRQHLQQLKKEYGVEPWHFEQHQGEGVFIPAGCPDQVIISLEPTCSEVTMLTALCGSLPGQSLRA